MDEAKATVRVEPLVNMGQLTRYLNPKGWALANMVEMQGCLVCQLCQDQVGEVAKKRLARPHVKKNANRKLKVVGGNSLCTKRILHPSRSG